jgi:hypothetical protein
LNIEVRISFKLDLKNRMGFINRIGLDIESCVVGMSMGITHFMPHFGLDTHGGGNVRITVTAVLVIGLHN